MSVQGFAQADYPISLVNRARALRAGGWSLRQVAAWIGEETGRRPSCSTVLRWTDPRNAARKAKHDRAKHRERSALGARSGGRLGTARHTPEFKLARMRALRARRLSFRAIGEVMAFDYGDQLTATQVEYALTTGRYPGRRHA